MNVVAHEHRLFQIVSTSRAAVAATLLSPKPQAGRQPGVGTTSSPRSEAAVYPRLRSTDSEVISANSRSEVRPVVRNGNGSMALLGGRPYWRRPPSCLIPVARPRSREIQKHPKESSRW